MLSRNVAQEAQGTGRRLRPRMKAVADPRLGENVVRVRRIKLNFLAELADEDAQVLGLLDVVTTPDSPQQNAMREHFPGMADQVYQQVVFLRRQMHLLTPYGDPAGVQVDAENRRSQAGW